MDMSVFENDKEAMGLPKDGQKITFKWPCEHGWFTNVVDDQKYLTKEQEYTVRKTQLNSSSAYVWLEELEVYDIERDLPFFSIWAFDWEGRTEEEL
jgi:hypothetical protein